jgi:hypothetical protein
MMKANEVARFQYKKSPEDISSRVVFLLSVPGDKYFGVDLSEFDEDEQLYYMRELEILAEIMKQGIEDLGLQSNYRLFSQNKVVKV